MFIGTYEHTLDAKGRVSVPTRYRETLGAEQRLVIAANLEPGCRCLWAFPIEEWHGFVDRLGAQADLDPDAIRLNRLVMASAVECGIDKQGRVLLPPTLREFAGIGKDVLWAGVGRRLELWDKGRFDEEREQARQELAAITRALGERRG
jgi:MraZ protein